jgi:hypothetical protein
MWYGARGLPSLGHSTGRGGIRWYDAPTARYACVVADSQEELQQPLERWDSGAGRQRGALSCYADRRETTVANDRFGVRWGLAGGTTLATVDAAREAARFAEAAGCDSLWISHGMAVDPIVALACVGADAPSLPRVWHLCGAAVRAASHRLSATGHDRPNWVAYLGAAGNVSRPLPSPLSDVN